MQAVFLGTPEFAVPALRALADIYRVVGVVTQPDRPAGRGRRLQAPPVKLTSAELGLPLIQPERVGSEEAQETLRGWAPDVIVVAAYGQILRPPVLDLPPFGCLNIHASLLPRWRGASPVQHALLHGDQETGTTLMKMDAGLDTGPILARRSLPIRDDHTATSLEDELAELGALLIVESLPSYFAGDLQPAAQDDRGATYAPRLKHADGLLDPRDTAQELQRRVRALNPWPGTYLPWGDVELAVLEARAAEETLDEPPGTVSRREGFPAIATPSGWLILDRLQIPGKKPMDGKTFLRGQPHLLGARLAIRAL